MAHWTTELPTTFFESPLHETAQKLSASYMTRLAAGRLRLIPAGIFFWKVDSDPCFRDWSKSRPRPLLPDLTSALDGVASPRRFEPRPLPSKSSNATSHHSVSKLTMTPISCRSGFLHNSQRFKYASIHRRVLRFWGGSL